MYSRKVARFVMVMVASLMLITALVQCAAPAPTTQVVEKVVTQVVEKEKIVEKPVEKVVQQTVVVQATGQPAAPASGMTSAERAVQEARKYKGTTLNVTWEAALQSQDPLLFSGPLWEQLTGIKINVVQLQFPELYSKPIAEHIAGTNSYDVLNYSPAWTSDMAQAGVLEPLDSYIDKYMDKSEMQDLAPFYAMDQMVNGKTYGLFDDGDAFIMYYRKDWFDDKQNQADFKAKFNRDLTPPKTWQEWDEVCGFFTEKFKAQEIYGCGLQRAEGQVFEWFYDHFRINGGKFFDDNMKATINSEAGVKTLQEMVASNKYMPPGVEKWDFVGVLSAWLSGKVGMIITWPPIGRWSEGYGTSTEQLSWVPKTTVAGKVGYAIPPGGHSEIAGGFNLGVSADSKNKEAAYLFTQWLQSRDISLQRVKLPFTLRDPYRLSHYSDPLYNSLWPAAKDYLATLKAAGEAGLADPALPAAREYEDALDKAVTEAMGGGDPKAALDKAAAAWDAITERVGVDKQKAAWQEFVKTRGEHAYPAQ
jgi:multiple sugar transport system substrate-binding protein